jgi:hypothetical protein
MNRILVVVAATAALSVACSSNQTQPVQVASQASCQGLSPSDTTLSAFYEPGAVYEAEPLKKKIFLARAIQPTKTMGAAMHVRAKPGMTAEYLERVLSCHASFGEAAHPNDPLHPSIGRIDELAVRSANGGFAVEVLGDGPKAGREIWQRARALSQPGSSVQVEQVSQVEPNAGTL